MTTRSNELALCIINDGYGSQCGADYVRRCAIAADAEKGINQPWKAREAARQWLIVSRTMAMWYEKEYGSSDDSEGKIFSCVDILLAAAEVAEYYHEHIKEMTS